MDLKKKNYNKTTTTQSLKNTALRWLTLLSPSSESPGQAADGPSATSTAPRILWQLMQAPGQWEATSQWLALA